MYGFDVVILALAVWLVGAVGLHRTDWPWDDAKPARRKVQRWAARLAPRALDWLQTARARFIDHVALSIPLRSVLVVARWRWPGKPAKSQAS